MSGSARSEQLGYALLAAYCSFLDTDGKVHVNELISSRGKVWLSRLSDEALLLEASGPLKDGWLGTSICVLGQPMSQMIRRFCEAAAAFLPASRIDTVTGPLIPADPTSPLATTITATCSPQKDMYGVKQEVTLQMIRLLLS